jgi:hypothetical protein
MTVTIENFCIPISPDTENQADAEVRSIAEQLWSTVPEEHRWIANEEVIYMEARTGPCWIGHTDTIFNPALPFFSALVEFAKWHQLRAGFLLLASGARVRFRLSDTPVRSFFMIEIPAPGKRLPTAHSLTLARKRGERVSKPLYVRNVPNPNKPNSDWSKFALAVNGFEMAGSVGACARIAKSTGPKTLKELRITLYYYQRVLQCRKEPQTEMPPEVRKTLREIREKVARDEFD